ncbi:amino acid transporter [Mycolicibacterium agri]|uniref:Amino acid permease n=1 Tax=Mycolicibacterium agri TaxID=36811 RepID=A0A2A7N2V0_MYCAG|nr:amino acid permease [Mycolicibacterium agri]PEG38226.1 amino acid transporter [Mycolicibacterium agri]GFG49307.1 amino acid permease [Mycolicibacterium agri]
MAETTDTTTIGQPAPERLLRGFSFRSALSLAFADVSPIAAVYAIFTLGLFAAGPKFFWAFPIVLVGQLMVAAVFGELASRWPYAGSVYQWSRHVQSTTWGWVAAWAYMWGLTLALGTLSYAAGGFLLNIFGVAEPGRWQIATVAIAIILAGTCINMVGRKVLKAMVIASLTCEVIGSVGLGLVLLLFYRENPFSVLFSNAGIPDAASWASGPMLLAIAYVGWSFLGFEAAGSVAEEVDEPERNVPKAIILALFLVGMVVMFSAAALILSIPDLPGVVASQSGDVVAETLAAHLGAGVTKPLLAMFVIGFVSSFLAVQAAVSRCIWGAARDGSLPGSKVLGRLAGAERLPVNAIAMTALVAVIFVVLAGTQFYNILVNFNIIGFYIAFGVPVIGAALARLTGKWRPGPFNLGRWGAPVTYIASLWIIFETVNVAWPRTQPGQPWFINWASVLTTVVLALVGMGIYLSVRRNIQAPIAERLADTPPPAE